MSSEPPQQQQAAGQQQTMDPRTFFAAERTFLAWVRTGIALMGFGFVLARFGFFIRELQLNDAHMVQHSTRYSLWLGIALVVLGVGVQVYAAVRHTQIVRHLRSGTPLSEHSSRLGVLVALLLAFVGVAMAFYLVAVR